MPDLNHTRTIESLRGMLDELCSPDLTLRRAKVLRRRLALFLETTKSMNERAADRSGTGAEVRIRLRDMSAKVPDC